MNMDQHQHQVSWTYIQIKVSSSPERSLASLRASASTPAAHAKRDGAPPQSKTRAATPSSANSRRGLRATRVLNEEMLTPAFTRSLARPLFQLAIFFSAYVCAFYFKTPIDMESLEGHDLWHKAVIKLFGQSVGAGAGAGAGVVTKTAAEVEKAMAAAHGLSCSLDTVLGAARVQACLGKTMELMCSNLSKRVRLLGAGLNGGGEGSYEARATEINKLPHGDLKAFLEKTLVDVKADEQAAPQAE